MFEKISILYEFSGKKIEKSWFLSKSSKNVDFSQNLYKNIHLSHNLKKNREQSWYTKNLNYIYIRTFSRNLHLVKTENLDCCRSLW